MLLNSLFSILPLGLIGKGLIIKGSYIGVELPIKANAAYNIGVSRAARPLELDSGLLI